MNANEWEKVDEEFDFIIDSAESAQGTDKIEDVNEALDDIYRSIGRIKKITNGLERMCLSSNRRYSCMKVCSGSMAVRILKRM